MNKKDIGLRIKGLRTENDLSQAELAVEMGLDRSTISKVESGENAPTARILIELRRIFAASTDWILTGQGARTLPAETSQEDEALNLVFYYLKNFPEYSDSVVRDFLSRWKPVIDNRLKKK